MKALVVSNCATSAYTRGLNVLFPDWDVRGVVSTLAEQWLTSNPPHAEFVRFVGDCDICVASPDISAHYAELLPRRGQIVVIPLFGFLGLQPDCFHLDGFDSVLGVGGNLHSRVVVASFKAGLTPTRTRELFNPTTYEMFDFFASYDLEKRHFIDRFKQHNIDLSNSLERWIARGNFLYSYSHPRIDVLMEILCRAFAAADLLHKSKLEEHHDDLEMVPDDLSEGIIWPIYPEIARPLGLEGSLIWRKGRGQKYQMLDLDQFIAASFEALTTRELPKVPALPTWVEKIESLAAS